MIVSEMRLFQSIRAGKYGEETFFNQLRQPGIVIRRLDGYFSIEFEGETFCTEAANVRQWRPAEAQPMALKDGDKILLINQPDAADNGIRTIRRTRGPNKPKVTEPNGEA